MESLHGSLGTIFLGETNKIKVDFGCWTVHESKPSKHWDVDIGRMELFRDFNEIRQFFVCFCWVRRCKHPAMALQKHTKKHGFIDDW